MNTILTRNIFFVQVPLTDQIQDKRVMSGMTRLYLITREDKMIKREYQSRCFVCLINIIGMIKITVLVST